MTTLEAIAAALQVEVRELFGAGDFSVRSRKDDPVTKVLDRVLALSDEDAEWVGKLIVVALARRPSA